METYSWLLRSKVESRPDLGECLTRCRHCGIIFLTHPRNAGRDDLGCPFGCREAHRRRSSNERSIEYYRTEAGRVKKRIQNEKRGAAAAGRPALAVPDPCPPRMIPYLQMVISLIERRRVSREEILKLVARVLRQHSMARRSKIEHIVVCLNKDSP